MRSMAYKRNHWSAVNKNAFRSGLEDKLQKYLSENGVSYKYETTKIQWEDRMFRRYTPDFILPNGIIIEAKGLFTPDDRRKHKEINKQHPNLEIRFIFENSKRKIAKNSKTTYADWCDKLNIKWADKLMPLEWAEETGSWTNLFNEEGVY
jgi:hypothetical protein